MKKIKSLVIILISILTFSLASCANDSSDKVSYMLNSELVEIKVGEAFQLEVSENDIIISDGISYESENINIATVSKTGLVKGVNKGETKINVTVSDKTLAATVKVQPKPGYNLSQSNIKLEIGSTKKLELLNNGVSVTTGITWKSNDSDVASVTDGVITALKVGEASITAIYQNKSYIANVRVMEVFQPEGKYIATRLVPEMDNTTFTFDLEIKSNKTYSYSRRTVDEYEGGVISTGTWTYENCILVLTSSNTRMIFNINTPNQFTSEGEIETGRVDSILTFDRVE